MIYFLYGRETYFLRKRVNELREQFIQELDPKGMATHRFSADDFDFEMFVNAVRTSNLLSPHFFVSVEGLLSSVTLKKVVAEIPEILKTVKT